MHPKLPQPPPHPLDKCDPLMQAMEADDEVNSKSKAFCEFRNWRKAPNALTGHTGRCGNADPAKCHGNCNLDTG